MRAYRGRSIDARVIAEAIPAPCEELYSVPELNLAERVILDLACFYHRRAGEKSTVVSYQYQLMAYEFFQQFGLEESIAELSKGGMA